MKTVREQLIADGKTNDEISALERAFDEMGQSIDAPPYKPTPRPMHEIAATLHSLNQSKGIIY